MKHRDRHLRVPWTAKSSNQLQRPWPVSGVLGRQDCQSHYSMQPTGPHGVASLPGRQAYLEFEEMLNWLAVCYLLPRLDAGASGTVSHPNSECPPSQVGERVGQEGVRRSEMHSKMCSRSIKFKRDPRHIWQKAGLKETPHRLADLQDLPKG
ncbi:hypothetical protein FD755_000005 [Muntiacus reevesi]|uniref:Uncharacterized protein n=1 Tax=Muntiacus reevesi TaxID=9886 RepID=A0A5J5N005_MUNRE|nr:hypothetical protein FD755_000005 [Muntiacus reevesi]